MNLLFFCLSVALIGTANCITCECNYCETGPTCEASAEQSCYAVTVAHSLGGSPSSYTERGCIPTVSCKDGSIAITAGKGIYMRTNTKCCTTDSCNTFPEAPKEDTTVSKVACPSCFGLYPASCEPTVMTCADSEKQCINITGVNVATSDAQIPFLARGCASPSASDIQLTSHLKSGNTFYVSHH
nr:PREDICTED: phospholipase A2 inhibitor and Ly6/PLAUR domain-containing protein [Anolis carolinensis]|eukprot:XP_003222879.1 PREDICTED: phospholipase A2 inhibitor and Ly6/PLAUR domain-containing protein [Anolis carolinensis]